MKQVYVDSIVKAKSYYKGYKDVIHDLSHTERVVQKAKEIAKALDYNDQDFLELCGYWHDVAKTLGKEPHEEASAVMARDDLLERAVSQDVADSTYEAIRFHKSTANPITIEGKIIRDADKLEIFSVIRWQKAQQAGWPDYCIEDLKKTIANMTKYPDVFTFDYTKELYEKKLPEFKKFYNSVKTEFK